MKSLAKYNPPRTTKENHFRPKHFAGMIDRIYGLSHGLRILHSITMKSLSKPLMIIKENRHIRRLANTIIGMLKTAFKRSKHVPIYYVRKITDRPLLKLLWLYGAIRKTAVAVPENSAQAVSLLQQTEQGTPPDAPKGNSKETNGELEKTTPDVHHSAPVKTYKLNKAFLFGGYQQPWRNSDCSIKQINPVPSMICEDESRFLHWLTRYYFSGQGCILDLGPLAGGSTHALASGLAHNKCLPEDKKLIHSYDTWKFSADWGKFFPGEKLKPFQDIQFLFERNLKDYMKYVRPHKGDICSYPWTGEPIEVIFIDVAKSPLTMEHIVHE